MDLFDVIAIVFNVFKKQVGPQENRLKRFYTRSDMIG